jgi:hypothetical protein
MRKLVVVLCALTLAGAGTAVAAQGGTATGALTASHASAASGIAVSLTGLSGFPTSLEVLLQRGFTASTNAVAKRCTSTQWQSNGCPAASKIGTGSVVASALGLTATVPVTLFLATPLEAGDVGAIIIRGTLDGQTLTLPGRIFVPSQGGLELLFSSFAQYASLPVTLDGLTLRAKASHTVTRTVTKKVTKIVTTGKGTHKKRHRVTKKVKEKIRTVYSLLTNPSSCTGTWTGTAILTYSSGTDSLPFAMACTPK